MGNRGVGLAVTSKHSSNTMDMMAVPVDTDYVNITFCSVQIKNKY